MRQELQIEITHARRRVWVDGNPGLRQWWKSSGLQVDKFIRKNKAELDLMIEKLEAELNVRRK